VEAKLAITNVQDEDPALAPQHITLHFLLTKSWNITNYSVALRKGPTKNKMKIQVTPWLLLFASRSEGFAGTRTLATLKQTSLYESSAESSKQESIDRAPCFDGECKSDPDGSFPTTSDDQPPRKLGEATMRLGGPATGPTVWSEFGRLSAEHPNIANLGQGFPDWLPPKFALDSLVEAVMDDAQSPHQYTRTAGHPKLVKQLASRYSVHLNRDLDPMGEVAVTVGASQALYLSLQTLVSPGTVQYV
jgi:hypothetical protein